MTLATRLSTLKIGDRVNIAQDGTGLPCAVKFAGFAEGRKFFLYYDRSEPYPQRMRVEHTDRILWPEEPKAKPGVIYRHPAPGVDYRVGLVSGRLFSVHGIERFDPSLWVEVDGEVPK